MENKHIDYVRRFFTVERVIGKGGFGQVLVTSTVGSNKYTRYAIKCILPVLKPYKLASELRYLRDLGGQCNVVQLHTAQLHEGSLYIVMEMIEPDPFEEIVCSVNHEEIATYIRKLLEALKHVHSRNIIHRDIKPHNFLHNRARGEYLLVDFGLAAHMRVRPTLPQVNGPSGGPLTPCQLANGGDGQQKPPPTTPTRRSLTNGSSSIAVTPKNLPTIPRPHTANRHLVGSNLFADAERQRSMVIANTSYVNPARMLSPEKKRTSYALPLFPNTPAKRCHQNTNDTNDSIQMFKKLRVSNNDEIREPVKLTVGAYESPVTGNDGPHPRSARQLNNQDNQAFSTPKPPRPVCYCKLRPRTCTACMEKPDSPAPRSGTAGYKALEVLLHYPDQRTPVDIWAAGVMLFCLLAGHTPLFRDRDDSTLVAEIITLLGSGAVREAAKALGIRLMISHDQPGTNLKNLCESIRKVSKGARKDVEIPDAAYDLLQRMLDPNPKTRITASDALNHSWLSGENSNLEPAAEPLN